MSTFWWKLMARHQEVFVKCPEFQNRLYCACAHRRTRSFSMGGLDPFYSISTSPFQEFVRFKDNFHQLKKVWGPNHGHGYKLCIRVCLCTVFVFVLLFVFVFVFSPIEESLHATNHQGAGLAKATHPSPWAEPQWQISTNIDLKLSAGFYRASRQLSKDN